MKSCYDIVVVKGDGIGPEVTDAALEVLAAMFGREGVLAFDECPAGAEHF